MKRLIKIGFSSLILLSVQNLVAGDATWMDFEPGIEKAAKEKKHSLIDFYTDWCHWCKVMDEKTFQEENVSSYLGQRFVTVRVDAENEKKSVQFKGKTYTYPELTRAFGVTAFPSLAFLNQNGELVTIIPGYIPADEFLVILQYIDQRCYEKNVSFQEFKETGGCKTSEPEKK
jgi:thioredoxin-related protein